MVAATQSIKLLRETEPYRPIGGVMELPALCLQHSPAVEAYAQSLQRRYGSLSARERQVFALVNSGLTNKQIARVLDISDVTVKAHRGRVVEKMSAASLPDLVRMALVLGIDPLRTADRQMFDPNPQARRGRN